MCWMTKYKPVRFESLKLFHICTSKDSTEDKSEEKHFGYVDQTSFIQLKPCKAEYFSGYFFKGGFRDGCGMSFQFLL